MPEARTAYHHGNLRLALLESAERMLAETGAAELSLRELARQAGVSHGAPRQHFADKQALLDALAERGFDQLGAALDAALATADGPFPAQLLVFARTWVDFAVRHPALLDLMFASKNRPAAHALRGVADRAFARPSALIAEAQARGDIADTDPDRVPMAIFATLQGLAALITSGMSGDRPTEELITGTINTLLNGLVRPDQERGDLS
ncbi:MAG TPA: TetR/AcrR family transcriptional regulator [Pseudonocardiaceae bacterium]|jgi:AcrR family transcriptional regulator|nr:TetR/AcrR family transcriptional regulator [Pseudonocardiaceae bacterium]